MHERYATDPTYCLLLLRTMGVLDDAYLLTANCRFGVMPRV
jgi:hypothetical protein